MMVNSNSTRGRQHYTIAHEIYHLYFDENPVPHICGDADSGVERDANLFASSFLMPKEGILKMVSEQEVKKHAVELATVLRLEQLYQVSRTSLLVRLKDIGIIQEACLQNLKSISVKESARQYGYDLALYESGNEGMVIGDFGEKARLLFDNGKISEGHYYELLNMITNEQQG